MFGGFRCGWMADVRWRSGEISGAGKLCAAATVAAWVIGVAASVGLPASGELCGRCQPRSPRCDYFVGCLYADFVEPLPFGFFEELARDHPRVLALLRFGFDERPDDLRNGRGAWAFFEDFAASRMRLW